MVAAYLDIKYPIHTHPPLTHKAGRHPFSTNTWEIHGPSVHYFYISLFPESLGYSDPSCHLDTGNTPIVCLLTVGIEQRKLM